MDLGERIADNRRWVLEKLAHEPVIDCNGCTKCCRGKAIFLYPEAGDNPDLYRTEAAFNPYWGGPGLMLQHKPNGECVYLTDKGCSIHKIRPRACRAYSCVEQVMKFSRPDIRRLKREGKWRPEDEEGARRLRAQRGIDNASCKEDDQESRRVQDHRHR